MQKFKSHKIPGIDKNICCAEQVIAYNYLFSWCLNDHDKSYALDHIQKELSAKAAGTYNELYHPIHPEKPGRYDYDLVYHFILQSWDRYIENNKPIFGDYSKLATIIYSDHYKAA